ncbi:hypothetical protein Zm00014a_020102 [Zea mays]|uniref:Uncharacterized protein n=1 Tax=Zea mays TaxID=4577 RepID=A0A3L6EZA7_MAIZE|nr:hypothetical protein Zm00014a_020102 [Zea mays]
MTTAGRDKTSMAGAKRVVARQWRWQLERRRLEQGERWAAFGSGSRRRAAVAVAAGIPATPPPGHPATATGNHQHQRRVKSRRRRLDSGDEASRGREVYLGVGGRWRLEERRSNLLLVAVFLCFRERWICPGVAL